MAVDLQNGQRELSLKEATRVILCGEHREAREFGQESHADYTLVGMLNEGLITCALTQDETLVVYATEKADRLWR